MMIKEIFCSVLVLAAQCAAYIDDDPGPARPKLRGLRPDTDLVHGPEHQFVEVAGEMASEYVIDTLCSPHLYYRLLSSSDAFSLQ